MATSSGVTLLVTGGRDYKDRERVFSELDRIHAERRVSFLLEGGAAGADDLARAWAIERAVKYETVSADWNRHRNARGKNPAGAIRNRTMLARLLRFKSRLACAFPGGDGTRDMCRLLADAGVETIIIRDEQPERKPEPLLFRSHPRALVDLPWIRVEMPRACFAVAVQDDHIVGGAPYGMQIAKPFGYDARAFWKHLSERGVQLQWCKP